MNAKTSPYLIVFTLWLLVFSSASQRRWMTSRLRSSRSVRALASFKLLATKIKSHLVDNIQLHGELCPGNFIYHHWEHMHVGEERSVRFRITKHGGDGSVMVRTGASFDAAPLKLEPPYLFMKERT